MLSKLTKHKSETGCETTLYSLDEIKQKFELKKISDKRDAWLALDKTSEYWLKFAIVEFHYSNGDGTNTMVRVTFHGEGSSGLRECRHTYWGEDGQGYIFYPHGKVISAAFILLSEYFDDMV